MSRDRDPLTPLRTQTPQNPILGGRDPHPSPTANAHEQGNRRRGGSHCHLTDGTEAFQQILREKNIYSVDISHIWQNPKPSTKAPNAGTKSVSA